METYRMHVQHINTEIVSRQIHRLKYLPQSHCFFVLGVRDDFICVILQGFLNKSEQMLLIHARCCMNMGINLKLIEPTFQST